MGICRNAHLGWVPLSLFGFRVGPAFVTKGCCVVRCGVARDLQGKAIGGIIYTNIVFVSVVDGILFCFSRPYIPSDFLS